MGNVLDASPMKRRDELAKLKERIAEIDRKFAAVKPAPQKVARSSIERWREGVVVANDSGEHFQMDRAFSRYKRHGSIDIGDLLELPDDLLNVIGENKIPSVPVARWAFLDTETTGPAGDAGACAFLIGVGRMTNEGFEIRQFFLRELNEESSALDALEKHLAEFDVLITYNGQRFDEPLLERRYQATGRTSPFSRLKHLDLLHAARRLWKLRLESCRLIELEQQILGVLREGDLPGEMIPYVYFEYLRSQEAERLVSVFHHNAIDILTLACLTAIVPQAFRSTECESLARAGVRRGEELLGLARWLVRAKEYERALELMKRAVDARLPDRLLFRTLWDIAVLEKKRKNTEEAMRRFTDLADCRNEYQARALEELARLKRRSGKQRPLRDSETLAARA